MLLAQLQRDDVRRELESLGVDPRLADERIRSLTDAEIEAMKATASPAGGEGGWNTVYYGAYVVAIVMIVVIIWYLGRPWGKAA